MKENYESVYTVTYYYDGPRGGIADFHGKPHVYSSVFDETADDWSDAFLLQPIDEETFRLAMEVWAIQCRWDHAYHAGQTTQATLPALPSERVRYDELSAILAPRLQIDPEQAIRVTGRFVARTTAQPGITSCLGLVVVWSSHETAA
jgi:hypothetical protein